MFLYAVRIRMSLCWFPLYQNILQSLYTQINVISVHGSAKRKISTCFDANKPAIKDMQSAQVREGLHVTCKHNGNVKMRDNTRHFKVSWNVNCTSQILYVETLRIALRTYVQKWINTWLFSINQKRKWCIKIYRAYWTSEIAQSTQSYSYHKHHNCLILFITCHRKYSQNSTVLHTNLPIGRRVYVTLIV